MLILIHDKIKKRIEKLEKGKLRRKKTGNFYQRRFLIRNYVFKMSEETPRGIERLLEELRSPPIEGPTIEIRGIESTQRLVLKVI